ncbi:glycogen synthase kinase-3 alpha-like [Adelges cooleyi]|uniref:glycogen synthase kinase-3 alpha-like n=1 Tax=Adelges cooleyi TaxID=133065 RepID=UPI00217FF1EA|nr:glycogen synthase kinase-3 alpha-like [Adelges cooleyi]
MEYAPTNMHRVIRQYADVGLTIDSTYAKLYTYQLFRALGHVHAMGLCHRDVKPRNLLVYPETGALKLCDFGSAKDLTDGRPNASYICSRHYRAPELLFGATGYTSAVDVWSAGCVYAELMIGEPAFPGSTTEEQRTLVTRLPRETLTATAPPEAARLVDWTLRLTASRRPTALVACAHKCYDELRRAGFRLPGGRPLPPLFDFTDTEMIAAGHLLYALLPNERLQNCI